MSVRLLVGACFFCMGLIGILTANALVGRMIRKINSVGRDGDRISNLGFSFPKVVRIFRAYRSSYPGGRLHIYALAAGAVGMAGLLGTAICIQVIG